MLKFKNIFFLIVFGNFFTIIAESSADKDSNLFLQNDTKVFHSSINGVEFINRIQGGKECRIVNNNINIFASDVKKNSDLFSWLSDCLKKNNN